MDKEVENLVKGCRGCTLAAKLPTTKCEPWPEGKIPWSRLHIDFAGPVNGYYYLLVVDSYTKRPETTRYKRPTSYTVINFLHELFAIFGVPDINVSDNGTQFVSCEFKRFCEIHVITKTIAPYHPRSNGRAERFVDTFNRALKKANKEATDAVTIQQFLMVYSVTPNPNAPEGSSLAELMFARKVKSVFNKLLPVKKKIRASKDMPKFFRIGVRMYKNVMAFPTDLVNKLNSLISCPKCPKTITIILNSEGIMVQKTGKIFFAQLSQIINIQ
eukprot:XP_014785551.1 PREDICTED: uncharacterized protein K02A2.6-like [Octopus bimaculoides]